MSTSLVLFVIYLDYAARCYIELDMIGLVFQSLIALALILVTLVACTIAGLPLRLSPRLSNWWKARQAIPLCGIAIAAVLLWLSIIPGFLDSTQVNDNGTVITAQVPNAKLVASGWALLAFCLIHFYPGKILEAIHHK